jgi:hypothetical protein
MTHCWQRSLKRRLHVRNIALWILIAHICVNVRYYENSYKYVSEKKVKQFSNRPGVAQRVPGGLDSQMWRWWVFQPHAPAAFTPRNVPGTQFPEVWDDPRATIRSEGNMSLKNPVTPPGIDPRTVRLVAQRLNHYATPGPRKWYLRKYLTLGLLFSGWCFLLRCSSWAVKVYQNLGGDGCLRHRGTLTTKVNNSFFWNTRFWR